MINTAERYLSQLAADLGPIETAADKILEQVGIRFEGDPDTLELWLTQGARVDGDIVFPDGAQLREIIRATAPVKLPCWRRMRDKTALLGPSTRQYWRLSTALQMFCCETGSAPRGPSSFIAIWWPWPTHVMP